MSTPTRTRSWRNTYAPVVLVTATLNVLDLTGVLDLPPLVTSALMVLNVVCLVRIVRARRADREAASRCVAGDR